MADPGTEKRIHVSDEGVDFRCNIGQTLAGATAMLIHIQKPDRTAVTGSPFTGAVFGQAADGVITVVLGDIFSVPGTWKRWAHVTYSPTKKAKGAVTEFVVHA
jgi:hypothetical protein